MTVKTLTGPSIQDALAEARAELGDNVVLMESTPATADSPAEIAVAVDPPVADTAATRTEAGRVPKPSGDGGAMSVPETGAGGGDLSPSGSPANGREGRGSGEGTSGRLSRPESPPAEGSDDDLPSSRDFGRVLEREQGPGRGQIFSTPEESQDASGADTNPDRSPRGLDLSFEKEERSRSGAHSGAGTRSNARTRPEGGNRWAHHPLYEALLERGLKHDTVTRLFDELSNRGVDPTNNFPGELRWACAKLLFQRIDITGPDRGGDNLMLIGPGGAGKTSLLLKMATHDRLLAGGKPMVIHLEPASGRVTDYQNPTSLYEKFGVPVRNVRTKDDLGEAMRHAERFGRVLIDTPPLPLPLKEGRSILRRVQSILRPLRPLNVHFALNATRALDNLDATLLPHLPIRPEAVAMTHLDEVSAWGRLVEWLISVNLPIQFASGGSDVPEGARVFSLEWFVEDVMDL